MEDTNKYQISFGTNELAEQRSYWAKVVEDQIASGMGAEKFCELHQVNFTKFHYWKYSKIRPSCIGAAAKKNPKIVRKCRDKKINKFIALQISPDQAIVNQQAQNITADRSSKAIEVIFKNGHKIMVPETITEVNLSVLIKVVGELPC